MARFVPYFELHVRPMFRQIDRDHMLWCLDLWDYDSVKANATLIQQFLRRAAPGFMPTEEFGGPWPEQWIQLFEAWLADGCPRLGRTKGTYTLSRLGSGALQLDVAIPLANGADNAWIEREQASGDTREYTVMLRPAAPGVAQPARVMQHVEDLGVGSVAQVVVIDEDGRHVLPIPA